MDKDHSRGQVYPEIASAPEPSLAIEGHAAVISGVRFIWTDHCAYCREQFRMFTDGGTIAAGIRVSTAENAPAARWYETWHPAGTPRPPHRCPNPACRHPAPFAANPRSHVAPPTIDLAISTYRYGDPCPVHTAQALTRQVWDTIRASCPDLAVRADAYDRRSREPGGGVDSRRRAARPPATR